MKKIQEELVAFVSERFLNGKGEGLGPDTPLLELRILDSLTIVELYAFVEQRYGVKLDDGTVRPKELSTIRFLSELIERRQSSRDARQS